MTTNAEAWGEHAPSGVMPLGTRVLVNEDGETPLDVWARLDTDHPNDADALLVLYQGGDVIAFPARLLEELTVRLDHVRREEAGDGE